MNWHKIAITKKDFYDFQLVKKLEREMENV
jgi:hypothetical protein